jgi:hypothetical protein
MTHEVSGRAPTSTAAGSKKGANARQYSIVIQGGSTHQPESGATQVKDLGFDGQRTTGTGSATSMPSSSVRSSSTPQRRLRLGGTCAG